MDGETLMEDANNSEPEMVLVPRKPTKEMIEAAWASVHDEDAAGVWADMIQAWIMRMLGTL